MAPQNNFLRKNKSAKIIMVFSAIIALTACSLSETSEDSLSTTETLDGSLELMSDNYSEEEQIPENTEELYYNSEITEDELKLGEKKVQELTDKFCKEIDELSEEKSQQVMSL